MGNDNELYRRGRAVRRMISGGDVNLPDEKAGKPVRSMSGGMTKGGAPDDRRYLEHNARASKQSMDRLQRFAKGAEAVSKAVSGR